jgi:hypothetical protein
MVVVSGSPVLWGFVGGLAAVGLRALVDLGLEERRLRREARAAARIVVDEVAWALIYIDIAKEDRRFNDPQSDLDVPSWMEHRALLAKAIGDPRDWLQLQLAMDSIRRLKREAARRALDAQEREFNPGDEASLTTEEAVINGRGLARLQELASSTSIGRRTMSHVRRRIRLLRVRAVRRAGREEDAVHKMLDH